ncbi:hypothetical protein ACF0H5_019133 [Mactra antiquata]
MKAHLSFTALIVLNLIFCCHGLPNGRPLSRNEIERHKTVDVLDAKDILMIRSKRAADGKMKNVNRIETTTLEISSRPHAQGIALSAMCSSCVVFTFRPICAILGCT